MKAARKEELRASLEELARLGSPVDLSVAEMAPEDQDLEIEQTVGAVRVFELKNGQTGYQGYLRITNLAHRAIYPVELDLWVPWTGEYVEWLEPYEKTIKPNRKPYFIRSCYRFPERTGPELWFEEVINHWLRDGKPLSARKRVEGLLLGYGGRLPDHLENGEMLNANLVITGADKTQYRQTVALRVDRVPKQAKIAAGTLDRNCVVAEIANLCTAQIGGSNPLACPPVYAVGATNGEK